MLILVVTLVFLCMVAPVRGLCVCTYVCVSLYVVVFLPLAVQSLAAAVGPQTEAVVVLTLYKKAVSSRHESWNLVMCLEGDMWLFK